MAGVSAERQETGVVDAINKAYEQNGKKPISVNAGSVTIDNVVKARKYTGRQASGSEPYTDVILEKKNGSKENLSLKGLSAPSLAGGGLRGLEATLPGITKKFMNAALTHLLTKIKLKPGDKVPDVYGKISSTDKIKVVVGTVAMGGPIDYMYIGEMDVKSDYNPQTQTLFFRNGQLIPAEKYAKSKELYFRLRARREDQRFDPTAKDNNGSPKIYGRSPSKGDSAGRIVVTDSVPRNAEVVKVI